MHSDGMIHIKAKKKKYKTKNPVVKLSANAYNMLVDICNESPMSMGQIASEIIIQSADRIVYDREDNS